MDITHQQISLGARFIPLSIMFLLIDQPVKALILLHVSSFNNVDEKRRRIDEQAVLLHGKANGTPRN